MSAIRPSQSLTAAKPPDPQVELRKLAREMEGVFYKQLFDAMRKSVPESGLTGSSFGQEVFTSLLDEKIASAAAERARHGLSEALYRQLSKHLEATTSKPDSMRETPDTRSR